MKKKHLLSPGTLLLEERNGVSIWKRPREEESLDSVGRTPFDDYKKLGKNERE